MADDVVRFEAHVPYYKWPASQLVFAAIVAGDWTLAKQHYDASPQDVKDAQGAVESWYKKFNPSGKPVQLVGTLHGSGVSVDFDYVPGTVMAFEVVAGASGSGSVIEGGEGLYGGFSDTLPAAANPFDPNVFPMWGKVAVNGVPVGPGKYLLLYSEKDAPLKGRASAG